MNKTGVIYCIENKINGLKYVGRTKNLKRRWIQHKSHGKIYIDKKIKEYGSKNFKIYTLERCRKNDLKKREKYWIKKLNTYEGEGYNLNSGAGLKGKNNPMYGKRGKLAPAYGRTGEKHPLYGVCGKKHHRYGEKMCQKSVQKMIESMPDKSRYNNPMSKITVKISEKIIKDRDNSKLTYEKLAKKYNTNICTIGQIVRGEHWTCKELNQNVV